MRVLMEEIVRGRFGQGERLPTEADLVNQFEASRGIVRETLRNRVLARLVAPISVRASDGASAARPS